MTPPPYRRLARRLDQLGESRGEPTVEPEPCEASYHRPAPSPRGALGERNCRCFPPALWSRPRTGQRPDWRYDRRSDRFRPCSGHSGRIVRLRTRKRRKHLRRPFPPDRAVSVRTPADGSLPIQDAIECKLPAPGGWTAGHRPVAAHSERDAVPTWGDRAQIYTRRVGKIKFDFHAPAVDRLTILRKPWSNNHNNPGSLDACHWIYYRKRCAILRLRTELARRCR